MLGLALVKPKRRFMAARSGRGATAIGRTCKTAQGLLRCPFVTLKDAGEGSVL